MKLFGTDGIRGVYGKYPILFSIMSEVGVALVRKYGENILIGKDKRDTGDRIELAIVDGIRQVGGKSYSVGIVPTGALSHMCGSMGYAGIMITASHNTSEYNGIKIFNNKGQKISKEEEAWIDENIKTRNYIKCYKDWILDIFSTTDFFPIKVALDCLDGATESIVPEIFKASDISTLGTMPLIKFDPDGDRIIISDEKGVELDGDDILSILYEKGDIVVGTDYSNTALENYVKETGGMFIRAGIGDREVAEKMRLISADWGGEPSGHIICSRYSETADGVLIAMLVLKKMVDTKKKLCDLRHLKKVPQKHLSLPYTEKKTLPPFNYHDARIIVRYSGTEPILKVMVEAEKDADKYMNRIKEVLDGHFC